MRRPLTPVSIAAVALVGLVTLGATGLRATAQDATPIVGGAQTEDATPAAMAAHPIVGSWRVNLAVTGAMDQEGALATFAADGTVLSSVKPVSPAPPDAPFGQIFASLAHGTWTVVGPNQVAFTIVRLQTDENGNYLGTVTVPAVLDVSSDGQRLSGPFTYAVADPAGNVVASGTGTAEGTRIAVEPMATPAAGTPSATPSA